MANIIVSRAQDSFSSNREKLDFAEGIALLDPNENPMTLMTQKFSKKTTGNMKHSWLYDVLVPETDTVDTTTACVTAGTTLYVDDYTKFAVGDVVRVNRTNETFLVTASASTGALTITRDYGKTSGAYTGLAGSFVDEEYLTILSNAFEQGHELPVPKSTQETQLDNWCQDFRTPFGISEIAMNAAVRGEADWPFQMKKAAITHQRKIELAMLYGHPEPGDLGLSSSGTGNDKPSTMGGFLHFITGGTGFEGTGTDRLVSQSEITQSEFLNWLEAAYEYGSAQKVLFSCSKLRSALDSWGISKLNTFSEKNVFGMNVAKWVSSHGTVVFVTHKMLKDPSGTLGSYNFLVDMNDVSMVYYSNIGSTRLRELDPYKATGKTIKQAEWQTICTFELRVPKKHACLYNVLTYA